MNKKKNTILVVDKEPETFKILDLILDSQEFSVIECTTGKQAIMLCASTKPDIVLLELNMPDMPASAIIASMHEWSQRPIIIISAKSSDQDIVDGLNMGADDYVQKPFNSDVLRARINAALRKSAIHETGQPVLVNGPLRMDLVRHEVFMNDKPIRFTPKEYSLLRFLLKHRGKMLPHRTILKDVWGPAHVENTQYLRVFIGQIRDKIQTDAAFPDMITTELGIGYRMELL